MKKTFNGYKSFAIVTGAASGMGREYSRRLARMGYNLIIVDINEAGLDSTASILYDDVNGTGPAGDPNDVSGAGPDKEAGRAGEAGPAGEPDSVNEAARAGEAGPVKEPEAVRAGEPEAVKEAGRAGEPNEVKEASPVKEAARAGEAGFRVVKCLQDLSQADAAAKVAELADKEGCDVEVLVNNAGMFYFRQTDEVPPALLSRMVMLHCHTPLMLCREFVPRMKARGKGYILNVSSLAAWMPWPGVGMYGNTKRFIKGFSRSLRIECRGTGVSVTNAYFGAVDTGLFGLPPFYRSLAKKLRVMVTVDKAVTSALNATFKRRKGTMPGVINHIFRPIMVILPDSFLHWLYRRLDFCWTKF